MAEKIARRSLTTGLHAVRSLEGPGRQIPIQVIADAVIRAGYTSLDAQAKALGVNRSTAWTIMKTKHKLGHLNNTTVRCILANPNTPVSVRVIIRAMLQKG